MKRLLSSDLVRYNANTRGTNTGDCTARAISLAFGIDYHRARKALNDSAKTNIALRFNSIPNVLKVIRELGGGEEIKSNEKITVGAWADKHNSGTYLIHCNRNGQPHGPGGHLVCIIDGKIYDSWDSRTYYVLSYHAIKSGISSKDISADLPETIKNFFDNKDKDGEWVRYITDTFDSIVEKNRRLKKLSAKYDVDIRLTLDLRHIRYNSYNFRLDYGITVFIPKYNISETSYSKIGITFKPTLPPNEVENYFDATFASKMHPFVNNMSIKAEDMLAGHELLANAHRNKEKLTFWNASDRKSFNSLPYWARQLATYFYTQPGDYSDRISLRMYRLPNDPEYKPDVTDDGVIHIGNSSDKFTLRAPNMDCLRAGLDYYKRTGDSEGAYDVAMDY